MSETRAPIPEYKKQFIISKFWDNFYYVYFIMHFLISVFMDSCGILGIDKMWLKPVIENYIVSYNDFLLFERPAWFQRLIWLEMLIQVPMFMWFFTMFNRFYDELNKHTFTEEVKIQNKARLHEWRKIIKIVLKVYAVLASGTTAYCCYVIYYHGHYPGSTMSLTSLDKMKLLATYSPMVYIPGILLFL